MSINTEASRAMADASVLDEASTALIDGLKQNNVDAVLSAHAKLR